MGIGRVLLLVLLSGCAANMTVTPTIEAPIDSTYTIKGKVIYEGKREYLPRIIVEVSEPDSGMTFQYSAQEIQKRDDGLEVLALFNPLTLVGFPTGGISSAIIGKLDVLQGNGVIKSYSSRCDLKVTRTIFTDGESFSELRRKGLIAVRDNIETQMYQDREFLVKASRGEAK